MESRFKRHVGFIVLIIGILLVLAGALFNPDFITTHFSTTDVLKSTIIQAIIVFELSVVCLGLLAIALGVNLINPVMANKLLERITTLDKRLEARRFYIPFCCACVLIALIIGLLLTKSGSNLSPDSISYITTGKNIYKGIGFLDYSHHPLYPIMIAGFMHLGCDALQAARLIPILSFALLMFPLFHLTRITGNTLVACIVCLFCLTLAPFVRLVTYAWVDMPYLLLATTAMLFLAKFFQNERGKIELLLASAIFTALATVTCLYGIALIIAGLIVIIIKNRTQLKRAFLQFALFGFISVLPVMLWMYRNFTLFSSPTAGSSLTKIEPITWVIDSINWIINTIPNELFRPIVDLCRFSGLLSDTGLGNNIMPKIITVIFILLFIYIIVSSTQRKALPEYLDRVQMPILYIAIHLSGIIIRGTMVLILFSWRYLSTIYPFLILAGTYLIFHVYKQVKRHSLKPFLFTAISILCIWFLSLQVINSISYYQDFKYRKGFNSAFWRNNDAIVWINNNVPEDMIVYSNNLWGISIRIENPVEWLPFAGNEEEMGEFFKMLKDSEDSYIVGFKHRYRKGRNPQITNEQIIEANQKYDILTVVADFPEATIWYVHR